MTKWQHVELYILDFFLVVYFTDVMFWTQNRNCQDRSCLWLKLEFFPVGYSTCAISWTQNINLKARTWLEFKKVK